MIDLKKKENAIKPKKIPLDKLPDFINEVEPFNLSPKGRRSLSVAMSMRNTKHGLYTKTPMYCKGEECPSYKTCPLKDYDLVPVGEKCPIEVAAIMDIFQSYSKTLNIDPTNAVDLGLVKELSNIEVTLDRCIDRLALENIVQDVTIGISDSGKEINQPQVHKAIEIYDRLLRRKHDILKLLSSTRSDKDKKLNDFDMGKELSNLIKKKREMEQEEAIVITTAPIDEADFEEEKK